MISGQFLRFGVAGAIGFVVDSLVLLAMTKGLGLSPYVGRAVSFPAALTTTWLINRAWAFKQASGKSLKDLLAEYLNYWAVQMTGGAVNLATFAVFVAIFGKTGLAQVAGVAAGSVAGMFVNYFGNKALVFGANETVARMQRWTQRAVWIGVATLVLLIPAMLNSGPFVYFDSEQYFTIGSSIASAAGELVGIGGAAPAPAAVETAPAVVQTAPAAAAPAGEASAADSGASWASAFAGARSPFYSLFLFLSSAQLGLWANAAAQALAGAWLIALVSAEFGQGFKGPRYLALVAALTVLTTIGYFAALPMPDVFAGYFLLAALLFLLGRRVNKLEKVLLWLLMALAASFHSTINLMAAAIAVISVVVLWAGGRKPVAALTAGALVVLAVVPGVVGGKVYAVASEKVAGIPIYSPPFLTARVIGDGPGQRFLDEQCPTGKYDFAVCRFSGRRFAHHNDFLWGVGGGVPAYQGSDMETQKRLGKEQFAFVLAVARAYPAEQFAASVRNALEEVFAISIDRSEQHTVAMIAYTWPSANIIRAAPQYERCVQQRIDCPPPVFMGPWEWVVQIAFYLSLVLAVIFTALTVRRPVSETDRHFNTAIMIIIPALIANAVICGVLSGVHARYQARIEWVLPALVLAASPTIWARLRKAKAG